MAYGSPASLDEVEPYYTDIRRGRPPTPELLEELKERYRLVGGSTPLLEISRRQAEALQHMLGPAFCVFLGMKHWHPYIRQAVTEMRNAGVEKAVGVVLAPHYSLGSVGEYRERVEHARGELRYDVPIPIVESWHLNPHYLRAVERHVREGLAGFDDVKAVTVVFTAHSLPARVVAAGDPYQDQLLETSRVLASVLNLPEDRWTFSFQSAGRTRDRWLGPDILQTIDRLAAAGVREILVAPVGFIADHLEIYYDIDHEAKDAAAKLGVRLERIESLNDDPDLIRALADVVAARVNPTSSRTSSETGP